MATQNVSEEQLQSQFTYIDAVARLLGDKRPKAYTHTFGCQQNEADTERIRGMLSEMGYEMTSFRVCSKSSSVSPGKPTIISLDSVISGIFDRASAISDL